MANSLKGIRELAKKFAELKKEASEGVQPTKDLLHTVFERLRLKDKPFQVFSSAITQKLRAC